jgi:hypothetical protein
MPYKINEECRHRIPKARYRVTNWRGCVANLEQGRENGRRSVTCSGGKQIELLCQ